MGTFNGRGDNCPLHVSEGSGVNEGDNFVDIETTKITNVCVSPQKGITR